MLKPLPIGIQTFSKIVENNCLYVDKTEHIFKLIENPGGAFFLSRPRRFGKSLLISTLDEIFSGRKELFQGLWIYNTGYDWKEHPVLRFDFSKQKAKEPEALIRFIHSELNSIANKYNLSFSETDYYSQFQELIQKLSKIEKVVILIDEYDKPIIDHLEDTEMAVKMREVMKGFFTILKGNDAYIRFLLLTGVSKFSKAGVFSNLNHLNDITFDNAYSTLLGITEEELKSSFSEYITMFSEYDNISKEELIDKIRYWYNGYRFSTKGISVYNPFSTLLLFDKKEFKHHWFETGTPEFLVKLLLKNGYDIQEIPLQTEELSFSSYEVDDLSIIPLLLQTGYLTIKNFDPDDRVFTLDYPNFEVKKAFLFYFLQKFRKKELGSSLIIHLTDAFLKEDIDRCIGILRELFLDIEYDLHIPQEKYYQTLFYLTFTLLGFKIKTEIKTNLGRIDAVIESKSIYIFEFKFTGSKEDAIRQINEKKYYEKYKNLNKPIYLIGAEFKDRNIGEYLVERLD